MDYLVLANTIVSGLMFTIWKKDDITNFVIKATFLLLFVMNILRLAGKV